jgi:hypothetical protein
MRRLPKIYSYDICHQNESSKTCPAQRQAFFCFVFFVATKKMTLLSGNPDGFAFILKLQSPNKEQQINDLLLSGYSKNSKTAIYPYAKTKTHITLSEFF